MALLALAVGVLAPRAAGWLDAAQWRGWRDDLRARLEALPVRAFLAGESMSLEARDVLAVQPGAPGGLEVRLAEPLQYSATGAASGGRIEFVFSSHREVWRVEPVTGRVTVLP